MYHDVENKFEIPSTLVLINNAGKILSIILMLYFFSQYYSGTLIYFVILMVQLVYLLGLLVNENSFN